MIRFIRKKIKKIRSCIQRPILQTGEYLDQIVIRSALMFVKKLTKYFRAGRL